MTPTTPADNIAMKKARNIHSLKMLDHEIRRLKREARNTEKELDENLHYIQAHYSSLLVNSLFGNGKKAPGEGSGDPGEFARDEKYSGAINEVMAFIAGRAADSIGSLVGRLFRN
jgi:hypothetical protein